MKLWEVTTNETAQITNHYVVQAESQEEVEQIVKSRSEVGILGSFDSSVEEQGSLNKILSVESFPLTSFDNVLKLLRNGKTVELRFTLKFGIHSRHGLSMDNDLIHDESYVDGSAENYTIQEYRESFHGQAFRKGAVQLEEFY